MTVRTATVLLGLSGALAFGAAVYIVVEAALRERVEPTRCGDDLVAVGGRCCARGQRGDGSRCIGRAASCPAPLVPTGDACAAPSWRVRYPGGQLDRRLVDWQAAVGAAGNIVEVQPFEIDAFEVTLTRWKPCVEAGQCAAVSISEPGLPVTGIGIDEARRFCRFAGGRLPGSAEWLFAAMGTEGRKFPWGATGLVCRRAAYGLVEGPCATGAVSPEWAGTRPDGVSPEGVYDLAGNVAEWSVEPDGSFVARGGSYRAATARDLKSTALETGKRADVGFRCAYDVE
jgi:formylglycine-generating enzyme required for sulfatase activity